MDEDALIEYYTDLLIYQYRGKPNARSTISILVKQLIAGGLLRSIEDAFWLETAQGAQLDILGDYVGLPRNIGPSEDREYFGFWDYVDTSNTNGFRDYTDYSINSVGVWYTYDVVRLLKTEVGDPIYSPMIRLKAALNVWDGTLAGAEAMLTDFLAYMARGEYQSANLVYNPSFLIGVDGWESADNTTGLPSTVASAVSPWALVNGGTGTASITGTPLATETWGLIGRDFPATAGQIFRYSGYVQSVGCASVILRVAFFDAFGTDLGSPSQVQKTLSDASSGEDLIDYVGLIGSVVAPANSTSARLVIEGVANGTSANPFVSVTNTGASLVVALEPESSCTILDTTMPSGNLCYATPAVSGTTGWIQTVNDSGLTLTIAAATGIWALRNNGTLKASLAGTPAAGKHWNLTTTPNRGDVVAGQRVGASVYAQGVGLSGLSLLVLFYDGAGSYLTFAPLQTVSPPTATNGTEVTDYLYLSGFATVPSGAVTAALQVDAYAAGTANPFLSVANPVLQLASETQTAVGKWVPGFEMPTTGYTWYLIEADLGIDPTTLLPYLPRKVGTSVRLSFTPLGLTTSNYTFP